MVLSILLIISILLQIIAAFVAIRLTKVTKFNLSWVLVTIALTLLAFNRFGQYYQLVADKELRLPPDFFVWLGVITSLCFAVGILYIRKIVKTIAKNEAMRRISERRVMNTVLRTEEKERMRFAKELHDGLGPLLSSAKMTISAIVKEGKSDSRLTANAELVVDEAIRSLREISNNLSPHILNDFGLSRAVKSYIKKYIAISKITIDFKSNLGEKRFDTDVEVILYRVICELITNSIKHSEGTKINIDMTLINNIIKIDYRDNGKGFNAEAVMDVGMGLSNINSRINSLKGTVYILSSKNKGVEAHIEVDLNKTTIWREKRR